MTHTTANQKQVQLPHLTKLNHKTKQLNTETHNNEAKYIR